jgi:hypothetical protein
MSFVLPTEISKVKSFNPKTLVLFAQTKTGKTEAISKLPNCLLVDLERGSTFVEAMKVDINDVMQSGSLNPLQAMKLIADKVKEAGCPYDYIALDTLSAIDEFAVRLATALYKQTPMGKSYTGKDVTIDLPQGGGWGYYRQAFEMFLEPFYGAAKKCLILVAHAKSSSINKNGKDLQAKDIAVSGKMKQIICADADAIGYLYRNPQNSNQTILSFKNHEQDLATGARPPHLSDQEFVILELTNPDYNKKGEAKIFTNGWDKVFKADI